MTDQQHMALIGASTSLQTRCLYALLGLLALFFPGYVTWAFLKAIKDAIQRLSFEDRCALVNTLKLD